MGKTAIQKEYDNANAELKGLQSFKYIDSAELKALYNSAYNDYNSFINNPQKNGYNAYINDVNELFDKVMNQESFSYDPQTDKLFQMYKQQYQSMGQSAMQNQMGVASAASGGYNSSAAQTSAQSAYKTFMDELSNRAAETYQNALDMYNYKQQNLLDRYNAAREMNNSSNDAYFKQADIRAQNMNSAYNAYNDERNFQYNQFSDNRSFYQNQSRNALDQLNWLNEYKLQKKLYKGG